MNTFNILRSITYNAPFAYAYIKGGTVEGSLYAYEYDKGTVLVIEADGLPASQCNQGIHAVYIHEGMTCDSNSEQLFAGAGAVLNLTSCHRPYRTGDLPPLYSTNHGSGWYMMYTDKFTPHQIIGRTITIHQGPNSLLDTTPNTTDPRIACGVIVQLYQ